MKALIRHSLSVGTRLGVGAVLLVALAVSGVRIALPMLSDRVAEVQAVLSELVGQPLQVGEVHADWTIRGPLLRLRGVGILDPGGEQVVLAVDELSMQVDIWRSVLAWEIVPHAMVMSGTAIEIHRRADTTVQVIGLDLSGMSLQSDPQVDVWGGLRDLAYRLEHSRIRWRDDITGADYYFDDVSLLVDLKPRKDRLKVAGFVTLPQELGESAGVMLDLEGDLLAPRGWRGRIYADIDGLRLEGLPSQAQIRRLGLREGTADIELWSDWVAGDLVDLRARLEGRDLSLVADGADTDAEPLRLAGVDAVLFASQLERGWRVDLEDLRLSRQGLGWGPTGISFETHRTEGAQRWRVGADFVRLQDLVPVLLTRSEIPADYRELVRALAPHGDLRDLRLDLVLPDGGELDITAQGEFRDLGFRPLEHTPGLTGLAGAFSLRGAGGEVLLDSQSVELDYPGLFEDPQWMDSLSGLVSWSRSESGYVVTAPRLEARNDDLETQTRFRVELGEDGPFLDLQVDYGRGNIGRAYQYLPFILPENVHDWLRRALVSGRVPEGRLLFHGRVADYPFKRDEGVFEARFEVEDAVLAYDPEWPRLSALSGEVVFRNASFSAALRSGNAFRLLVDEATVEIPDLDQANLLIDVAAHGPLADAFRFVRESPLRSGNEALLDDVETQGISKLDLKIDLPLDERMVDQTRVRGHLDLRGCSLRLQSADLFFSSIQGAVDFSQRGFSIDQITAEFRGDPLTVSASTGEDGLVTVDLAGHLRTANLLTDPDSSVSQHLDGSAYWLARLTTPGFSSSVEPSRLQLRSDLVGTEIRLPYPLGKGSEQPREFLMQMTLVPESAVHIRYGEHSAAVALERLPDGSQAVERAEIRFNDRAAELPARGVSVRGSLSRISLSEWQAALSGEEDAPPGPRIGTDGTSLLERLSELDFSADEVELWGHETRNVRVDAARDKTGWRGLISTSTLSGTFRLPHDMKSGIPLVMELEHLEVEDPGGSEGLPRPDPRDLPAMRISSKTFTWDGRQFTDLRLETTRVRDGLAIHSLQLTAPHLSVRMTGDWRVTTAGAQQSTVRVDLESDDFGDALESLDFDSGLTGGQGKLVANLRWPDALTQISWGGLEGTGKLDVEKGRFEDLKPGAGRLLGLMNLQYLPRRLTFDFSDIFKEGYGFDTIEGNYTLRGADIYTTDTEIIGPAADVSITGRTNVEAQQYDQIVTVTPHVKSALPIAGFLVGGLPVGAVVFLADTVFDVGKGLDRASRVKYRVTGPWDDPEVEVLSAPESSDAFPEEDSEFPRE